MIEAVVFDLDGLLLDTEQVWDEVREALVRERGGRWNERAQADMMGMSSLEWSLRQTPTSSPTAEPLSVTPARSPRRALAPSR